MQSALFGAGNEARTRDLNLGKTSVPYTINGLADHGIATGQQPINGLQWRAWQLRGRFRPFSATPRLRILPDRLSDSTRAERLVRIQARCIRLPSGCLLYPAVRDEGYPYIDLQNDEHRREQWSARRLVWALVNGPLPERGILMRRCVPKNCVTPAHQILWVVPEQIDWVSSSISGCAS